MDMAAIKALRQIVNEGLNGRVRVLIAWVFCAWLVLAADQYPSALGIFICYLGATLRFWASGFLRKDALLSVGGPYRFTRNPLYLGTFLIALGGVVSVEAWVLGVFLFLFFFFVYDVVVEFEESKLIQYFGDAYRKFCALVPRFVALKKPPTAEQTKEINPDPQAHRFSWELAMRNKAFEAYWSALGLVGFIYLVVYLKFRFL